MSATQEPVETPTKNPAQVWSALIGGAVGIFLAILMNPHLRAFLSPNSAAPPGAVRMAILLGVLSASLLAFGLRSRRLATAKAENPANASRPRLRRARTRLPGRELLKWNLAMAMWLFIWCGDFHWRYDTVGLNAAWSPAASLALGFAVYFAFIAALEVVSRLAGVYQQLCDNSMVNMARLCPRKNSDKILAAIVACLLNPVIEELMFRGILVYQLGIAIGSPTLPIAFGLAVSLANHAYQGWRAMATHLPFYVIAVGLLYSPTGLWGAIGFHFAGDLIPVLALRHNLRGYRRRHRHVPQAPENGEESLGALRQESAVASD